MDYSKIMAELEGASLFDMYRLSVAINKELDDPNRIEQIKRMINKGDVITYFESSQNRLVQAKVLGIKRTRVHVEDLHDMKKWTIPFHMINIEDVSTDITHPTKPKGMNRNELKIGDFVGFRSKHNKNVRGQVIRLNSKTVSLFVEPDEKWRVSYSMLYPIVDGETAQERKFIEGVVIERQSELFDERE